MFILSAEKIIYYINFIAICSLIIFAIIVQILWHVIYYHKVIHKFEYIIYNKSAEVTPEIRLRLINNQDVTNEASEEITNNEDFQKIKPNKKKTFTFIRKTSDEITAGLEVMIPSGDIIKSYHAYIPGKYVLYNMQLVPYDEYMMKEGSEKNSKKHPFTMNPSLPPPPFSDFPSIPPSSGLNSNKPSMLPSMTASMLPSMLPPSNKPSTMPSLMPSQFPRV